MARGTFFFPRLSRPNATHTHTQFTHRHTTPPCAAQAMIIQNAKQHTKIHAWSIPNLGDLVTVLFKFIQTYSLLLSLVPSLGMLSQQCRPVLSGGLHHARAAAVRPHLAPAAAGCHLAHAAIARPQLPARVRQLLTRARRHFARPRLAPHTGRQALRSARSHSHTTASSATSALRLPSPRRTKRTRRWPPLWASRRRRRWMACTLGARRAARWPRARARFICASAPTRMAWPVGCAARCTPRLLCGCSASTAARLCGAFAGAFDHARIMKGSCSRRHFPFVQRIRHHVFITTHS